MCVCVRVCVLCCVYYVCYKDTKIILTSFQASVQLLTVLQFYMPRSEDSLPPSTPSDLQEASVMEDAPLNETEAYHSLAQLSQHSSLLSEGSAIAEIERELQAVMGEEVEERRPTPARRSAL